MSKRQAIEEKLEIARSWLEEVEIHLEHKFYATAVSRLYYACFYVTQGLLLTKDLHPKTHEGTVRMLHAHFVKAGLFERTKSDFYSKVLNERMQGDYGNPLKVTSTEVQALLKPGKEYIDYVTKIVQEYIAQKQ